MYVINIYVCMYIINIYIHTYICAHVYMSYPYVYNMSCGCMGYFDKFSNIPYTQL